MRKFLAILLTAILLAGLVGALAEAAKEVDDMTGDWTCDYFTIPMIFAFNADGTFTGTIDMDIPVADDGSNSITGEWTFDGTTLTIADPVSGENFDFTWDGEKLTGIMYDTEIFMYRAEATSE